MRLGEIRYIISARANMPSLPESIITMYRANALADYNDFVELNIQFDNLMRIEDDSTQSKKSQTATKDTI